MTTSQELVLYQAAVKAAAATGADPRTIEILINAVMAEEL